MTKPKVEILKQNGHHFLWIDGECWMWDLPTERRAQAALAAQAFGNVLVAGYGLGLVQRCLLGNPEVTSVLTAENCDGVVDECRRVYGKVYGDVITADFFRLHETAQFDCVLGDIWLDIAPEYLRVYLEFKRKAQHLVLPGGKILAWGSECFEIWLRSWEPELDPKALLAAQLAYTKAGSHHIEFPIRAHPPATEWVEIAIKTYIEQVAALRAAEGQG